MIEVSRTKILVIGSGGMLGHLLTSYLRRYIKFAVTDISRDFKLYNRTVKLDVLNVDEIEGFFEKNQFDVIINCVASLVKASEQQKAHAIGLNAWFPHWLVEKFANQKTRIIHISTDGVFLGKKAVYYLDDLPDAVSFYGKTKALGEFANQKDLLIRTSVWGPAVNPNDKSLFQWFVQQKDAVEGYDDVLFNGVSNLELAKCIESMIANNVTGRVHIGAAESISKGQLLEKIKREFGLEIDIQHEQDHVSSHILGDLYQSASYAPKTYDQMLKELKIWMTENQQLYGHYGFI